MKSLQFLVLVLFVFGPVSGASARNPEASGNIKGNGREMAGNRILPGAGHYLAHQKKLKLTGSQVKALQNERLDLTRKTAGAQTQLKIARAELKNLLAADPVDPAGVERKVREIETLRGDLRLAGIKSALAARNILTTDQHRTAQTLDLRNTRSGMQTQVSESMGGF